MMPTRSPGCDAARDEALGDGDDLGVELPRGQGDPGAVLLRLVLDEDAVGRAGDALGEQVVEVLRGVDLDAQRDVELVHAGSSDRGAKCAPRIRDVRPRREHAVWVRSAADQVAASSGHVSPGPRRRIAWEPAPDGSEHGTSA